MKKTANTVGRLFNKCSVPAVIVGAGVLLGSNTALADVTTMAAAVDISAVSTAIETIFTAVLAISVLGAGFLYVKRAIPGRF